ncbi:MAG: zinc ribbon domain-containing protein [Pyrinomonadaceae bacterium]
MTTCNSCGAENADGAKFCVRCGAAVVGAASPGSWRDASGDLNTPISEEASGGNAPGSAYAPPYAPPPSSVGNYPSPPAPYGTYGQPPQPSSSPFQSTTGEPMHPAIPAVVSLIIPGIGLLFVPNKAGLGIGVFVGYIAYTIVAFILSFVFIGLCLFLVMPLINVLAAVHSWDEAAKASNGKYQPLLFKS